MDLRTLHYFISIYEQGSISGAAKACFVAQPSISASIQLLEEELTTQLFYRHARGVKASDSGKQLYPLAKKLLGQADAIKSLFKEKNEKIPVSLGLTKGLGVARMSAILKDFTSSFEFIELTLVSPNEPCDAKIVAIEESHKDDNFIPMWQEDYVLALPHNHILSLKNEIELSDLHQQPFIQRTPCSAWQPFIGELTTQQIHIDIRAKIQTIDYALGLVNAGVGLAFLPLYSELEKYSDISFRKIKGLKLTRKIGLAYQQENRVTKLLKQLITRHC
ncbi:MAG: LysR family transcriptional regulator [Gammaproteobacteria bacterium]|nr:MAG: LysR family transcriptional regulator [Gammaproteobacteria bacterium]